MMNFNFQKIIAITTGVLVLAISVNYFACAWNPPPLFSLPVDISSDNQTKAGELTVGSLTLSELSATNNQVFLNTSGNEGDIYNIGSIQGYNDLHLWSEPTGKATVYLDETEGIKFYTNSAERMVVGSDNNIYISDDSFEDCFLRVDGSGKIECYTGSNPPDGKFRSTQAKIMKASRGSTGTSEDFRIVINEEAVVKITANFLSVERNTSGTCMFFPSPFIKSYFYIKKAGSSVWDLEESLDLTISCWSYYSWGYMENRCQCPGSTKTQTWYHHVKQGDEIKIVIEINEPSASNLSGAISGYNLTFKRQTVSYVFTDPGHDVLHYFSKNTTEKMNSTPDAYWTPTPVSMVVTADNAPISIVIPPE